MLSFNLPCNLENCLYESRIRNVNIVLDLMTCRVQKSNWSVFNFVNGVMPPKVWNPKMSLILNCYVYYLMFENHKMEGKCLINS